MSVVNEGMKGQLKELLNQSLNPSTNKQAEALLKDVERANQFLPTLLSLIYDSNSDLSIRLASVIYFKNFVRREWFKDGEKLNIIPQTDRKMVKDEIINLMLELPLTLRSQIADTVELITQTDFCDRWSNLLPDLMKHLNVNENEGLNKKVLENHVTVLKAINFMIKTWRVQLASDVLNQEMLYVLKYIDRPILSLLRVYTFNLSQPNNQLIELLLQASLLLTRIYYSCCYHDIPQYFEDNNREIFNLFHGLLIYQSPIVESQDDEEAGVMEKIRTSICEICQLYHYRYHSDFQESNLFLTTFWTLLVNVGQQPKYDIMVSKALKFIGIVIKREGGKVLFSDPSTMATICEKIIVPNCCLRESDLELFQDEPLQYVIRELDGSDADSRRQASMELIRDFLAQMEVELSQTFLGYTVEFLNKYKSDPIKNWRDKDTALFLFTAIAIKTFTYQKGAIQTSTQVNISDYFSENVLMDLNPNLNLNPILRVSAIKFILNFRNQLIPQQLLSLLPILTDHLANPDQVIHTFSAICLERILYIKTSDGQLIFTEQVISECLDSLLSNLFSLLTLTNQSQKMSENEYIMKCLLRVMLLAKNTIINHKSLISQKLGDLLAIVSKNPSNPKYNHYLFECIGAVIKHAKPTVLEFEQTFWSSFQYILTQNVIEFVPYVLQIITQLIAFHPPNTPLPQFFKTFWPPLLQAVMWQSQGNVPALVKLLKGYIYTSTDFILVQNNLVAILGIFDNLLNQKLYDQFSFELLECIFNVVPLSNLEPYLHSIFLKILMRLKQMTGDSKAFAMDKLVQGTTRFLCFLLCLTKKDLSTDLVIDFFNRVDPSAFGKMMSIYILPRLNNTKQVDRNLIGTGLIKLMTETDSFLRDGLANLFPQTLSCTIQLLAKPITNPINKSINEIDESYDLEDQEFQASFVKLATTNLNEPKILKNYPNPEKFLISQLLLLDAKMNGQVNQMVSQLDPEIQTALNSFNTP